MRSFRPALAAKKPNVTVGEFLDEIRASADVSFEPRQSLKYRSSIDVQKLITAARAELRDTEPECFKIFLLAVMVGLRRGEIDLLEWDSFRWDTGFIRIEPTEYFLLKTEDSIGEIPVDPELMKVFRGYRARRPRDRFVIMASGVPKPCVTYMHYRCQQHFERLTAWLRNKGVREHRPIHMLRKEFGSQINAAHGIHAASRALRHADIVTTHQFYADSQARVRLGLGHLLSGDAT